MIIHFFIRSKVSMLGSVNATRGDKPEIIYSELVLDNLTVIRLNAPTRRKYKRDKLLILS